MNELLRTCFHKYQNAFFLVLIGVFLAFHGWNNYFIARESSLLINPDSSSYYGIALHFLDDVTGEGGVRRACGDLFRQWKPPLYFFAASPFLLIQRDIDAAVMVNLVFGGVLLLAVYGIGKRLYNPGAGLLAAFLLSMFPTVFALSRVLLIETALAAMVALTLYLFVVNRFDSLIFSLLTGLVIGLGLLTKQPYAVYFLPVGAYFFLQPENRRDKKRLLHFFGALLVGALVAAPWYLGYDELSGHSKATFETYGYYALQCKTKSDFLFYVRGIFSRQLLPLYTALFLAAAAYFVAVKRYFMPSVVILALLLFSLSPNRADRFILPLFPFIAVMIAAAVLSLKRCRTSVVAVLVLASVAQFYLVSYRQPAGISRSSMYREYFLTGYYPDWGQFSIVNEDRDWKDSAERIVRSVEERLEGSLVRGMVMSANHRLRAEMLYQFRKGNVKRVLRDTGADGNAAGVPLAPHDLDFVKTAEFVLMDATIKNRELAEILSSGFSPAEEIVLPDGNRILVYLQASRGSEKEGKP